MNDGGRGPGEPAFAIRAWAPLADDALASGVLGAYFREQVEEVERAFGSRFDPDAWLAEEMGKIGMYLPPDGRLLLAVRGGEAAGCGAWRRHPSGTVEIKRVFVRPGARGAGLGRMVLRAVLEDARASGASGVVLDAPAYAVAARALYRAEGFEDIPAYPEAATPERLRGCWHFMGRAL